MKKGMVCLAVGFILSLGTVACDLEDEQIDQYIINLYDSDDTTLVIDGDTDSTTTMSEDDTINNQ